jgi:hypothetical protein
MIFSDVRWGENNGWNNEQVPRKKYEETEEFKKEFAELNNSGNE